MTLPSNAPNTRRRKYDSAESRWAGVGPYYAMFPSSFADKVIDDYTQPGDVVLDPFAGRGTAVYSAATKERRAIGIEISPLGFVYSNAKLKPGKYVDVIRRLEEVADSAHRFTHVAETLPRFFHRCFSRRILQFLLSARENLDWRTREADRTLMALILISLHGKRYQSLSNQMRQSTAMSPEYCIRWWAEKDLWPPDLDPVAFIGKRVDWRYVHGVPKVTEATVILGDSILELPQLKLDVQEGRHPKANLLLTSPPYHNVTNYYYDQWLRLWLLGCPESPAKQGNLFGGKFSNLDRYRQLLSQVFVRTKPLLVDDAIIYVRTDQRKSTLLVTSSVLREVFPEKDVEEALCPLDTTRQSTPYSRGGAPKRANCEVDFILKPH